MEDVDPMFLPQRTYKLKPTWTTQMVVWIGFLAEVLEMVTALSLVFMLISFLTQFCESLLYFHKDGNGDGLRVQVITVIVLISSGWTWRSNLSYSTSLPQEV